MNKPAFLLANSLISFSIFLPVSHAENCSISYYCYGGTSPTTQAQPAPPPRNNATMQPRPTQPQVNNRPAVQPQRQPAPQVVARPQQPRPAQPQANNRPAAQPQRQPAPQVAARPQQPRPAQPQVNSRPAVQPQRQPAPQVVARPQQPRPAVLPQPVRQPAPQQPRPAIWEANTNAAATGNRPATLGANAAPATNTNTSRRPQPVNTTATPTARQPTNNAQNCQRIRTNILNQATQMETKAVVHSRNEQREQAKQLFAQAQAFRNRANSLNCASQ